MVDRRQFLAIGAVSVSPLLAGCSDVLGGNETDVEDSDGDGVIDSEDYAPRDPDVQERSDIVEETTTDSGPDSIAEFQSYNRDPMEGYQCSVTATVGSADRIEVVFESHGTENETQAVPGEVLVGIRSGTDRHVIFAPNDDFGNGPLHFGDRIVAVAVTGSGRDQIAETIIA